MPALQHAVFFHIYPKGQVHCLKQQKRLKSTFPCTDKEKFKGELLC